MVVVSPLRAAFRVASRPHAHIHRINGGHITVVRGERMASEQIPQTFGVEASSAQSSVEACPSAAMRRPEAQMSRRGGGTVCGEDGVRELEEGVFPAVEAFVERAAEGLESIGRFHGAPIMRSPRAYRIFWRPRS
jgi:hypothetical protein